MFGYFLQTNLYRTCKYDMFKWINIIFGTAELFMLFFFQLVHISPY